METQTLPQEQLANPEAPDLFIDLDPDAGLLLKDLTSLRAQSLERKLGDPKKQKEYFDDVDTHHKQKLSEGSHPVGRRLRLGVNGLERRYHKKRNAQDQAEVDLLNELTKRIEFFEEEDGTNRTCQLRVPASESGRQMVGYLNNLTRRIFKRGNGKFAVSALVDRPVPIKSLKISLDKFDEFNNWNR